MGRIEHSPDDHLHHVYELLCSTNGSGNVKPYSIDVSANGYILCFKLSEVAVPDANFPYKIICSEQRNPEFFYVLIPEKSDELSVLNHIEKQLYAILNVFVYLFLLVSVPVWLPPHPLEVKIPLLKTGSVLGIVLVSGFSHGREKQLAFIMFCYLTLYIVYATE